MRSSRNTASARAGRRRKLPRAEREQQMIGIAAREFGRRGFHAASMDDIARACGVTKPMLYAYFDSKEGLFLAVVDHFGKALLSAVVKLLAEKNPRERLVTAADLILDFIIKDRHAWRVLYAEGLGDTAVARHVAGYRNRIIQLAALTLGQARPLALATATGRRRAELYAVGMIGAGEAIARLWLDRQSVSAGELQAMARRMVDSFLREFLAIPLQATGRRNART